MNRSTLERKNYPFYLHEQPKKFDDKPSDEIPRDDFNYKDVVEKLNLKKTPDATNYLYLKKSKLNYQRNCAHHYKKNIIT